MLNAVIKKTKLVRRLPIIIGCAVLLSIIVFFAIKSHNRVKLHTLHAGDTTLQVEIATSSQEQTHGLCCRDTLAQNQGMLFIYDRPLRLKFWMKDMRFPIDIIWIDHSKKVAAVSQNVSPKSYPKTFSSPRPSQYVLEVNAGYVKKHNISIGTTISF